MWRRGGDELQRPLPCQHQEPKDEVQDLQHGDWFDGDVEAGRDEVPEDLGPEEALNRSADLPYISPILSVDLESL